MSEARRKAAKPSRRKKHWALRLLGWLAALMFLGIIGAVAAFFVMYQTTKIPDINKEFTTNTTTLTYADQRNPLGSFYEQNRHTVPLSQVPKRVQDAVIAAEDRTFWTNPGISPSGMVRAAVNIARGEQLQGGSTITQQYVKIMYLNQERTVSRKLKELFIATKLGRSEDKNKTLEGYLNTIYFGEGAYGISAAGDAYFKQPDPNKLTVQQAALLATVLNNPSLFDVNDPDPRTKKRIIERYQYVLDGMRQMGTITQAQQAQYGKSLPSLKDMKKKSSRYAGPNGFLLDMARKELLRLNFTEDQISGGGLKVTTTFNYGQQNKMLRAAQNELPKKRDKLHVGMAAVQPGTGQLLAMYGGPDYLKSQLNWATSKARPGSSFKPFALAAALEDKKSIWDTFQGDSPIVIQGLKLNNEFNQDYGDVSLLKATEQSINTAFYDLVDNQMDDGPNKLVDVAEAVGIPKTKYLEAGRHNPSTVLGPDPYASAVDMASAYATFAADGKHVPVHVIKEVRGPDGKVLWSDASLTSKATQAIPVETAQMVNYVLQDVVQKGTGSGAKDLDRPVAGKTGTAGGVAVEDRAKNKACDGCKDGSATLTSWWTGYTPQLSTSVVYRAGNTGESNLDDYTNEKAFFGGTWPLKTWLAYMKGALEGVPDASFAEPTEDALSNGSPTPEYTPPTNTPTNTPASTPPPNTPASTPPPNTPTRTPPPDTPTPPKPTKTRPTKTPDFPTLPTGGPGTPTDQPTEPAGGQ
ncbi:transglycosylase domain-containing protein [Kribbella solani]|uniref:transglycosylase domain-containing protein n=1 Tax=Kribbella solani TaxID=236067 RepID=UPI0029A95BBD|nr:transglycosylase domain-containing protein [Kribbella solani]MDX2973020.1 transglycosylase domain-containing protein [Kribbella solani]MDX3001201.1 transglycosylase domain-containing protein [Kribbella solani]